MSGGIAPEHIAKGREALKALQSEPPPSARRGKRNAVMALIDDIAKCQERGVTIPQIRTALTKANIEVGERTIRRALDDYRDGKR